MRTKIARYKIPASKTERFETVLESLLEEIAKHEPETIYEVYRVKNDAAYLHIIKFPDAVAEEKHKRAIYTAEFIKKLYGISENGVNFYDLIPVGYKHPFL